MIVSHKHKFIFIKTQKTAGSSIKVALSKFCGPDDIISAMFDDAELGQEFGYIGAQNNFLPYSNYTKKDWFHRLYSGMKVQFFDHTAGVDIRKRLTKEQWDGYYKFTFERNPFDKFISWYYWNGGDQRHGSMTNFIASGKAAKIKGFELYTDEGMFIVDKVYKFEALPQALADIKNKLALSGPLELPKRRLKGNVRKNKKHYSEVLNDFEKDWIQKFFAREIAYFDYRY